MLPKRKLGSTGLSLSSLALGTVKFGRNTDVKYPENFELPDIKTCENLVDQAYDLGFNTLDTAPAYGLSEQRIGEILKTRASQDWLICTKAGENYDIKNKKSSFDFSSKSIKSSLHNSLKLLNKSHIDIFLIHSDGNDLEILEQDELIQTLYDLKKDGIIRSHGISTKTVAGGLLACDLLDVVMVTHNLTYQDEISVINKAHELQKGILIKKGLASGNLTNPISAGIKFVLDTQGVTSLVLGSINPSHIEKNVLAACNLNK